MNDRIKLAEAMSLITKIEKPSTKGHAPYRIVYPNGCGQICDDPNEHLPDPLTDANDDYAVLEWMRTKFLSKGLVRLRRWTKAILLEIPYSRDYQIGDYARAALRVLE